MYREVLGILGMPWEDLGIVGILLHPIRPQDVFQIFRDRSGTFRINNTQQQSDTIRIEDSGGSRKSQDQEVQHID